MVSVDLLPCYSGVDFSLLPGFADCYPTYPLPRAIARYLFCRSADMSSSHTSEQSDISAEGIRGGWEGSDVVQDDLDWLRRTRRVPAPIICRIPGEEVEPAPQEGERVVFVAHFERGFALPTSRFFRAFLDKFELQPHHLPANSITSLSAFVAFSEGYLGLWPLVGLWARYFVLRKQSIPNKGVKTKEMTACGAATITARKLSDFPKVSGLESCRKWQRSFFYVKNPDPSDNAKGYDFLNLPEFRLDPPNSQANWGWDPSGCDAESQAIHEHLLSIKDELTADDLLRTFVARRISPLQNRVHKICHMSGPRDPTRISPFELDKPAVRRRVRAIAQTSMGDDWEWGLEPYSRANPPPQVSSSHSSPTYLRAPDIAVKLHSCLSCFLRHFLLFFFCSGLTVKPGRTRGGPTVVGAQTMPCRQLRSPRTRMTRTTCRSRSPAPPARVSLEPGLAPKTNLTTMTV